jgi:hypothetical protein
MDIETEEQIREMSKISGYFAVIGLTASILALVLLALIK